MNSGPGQSASISVTTTPRVVFGPPAQFNRGPRVEGPPGSTRRNADAMPDGEHIIGVAGANIQDFGSRMIVVLNWFDEVRQRVPAK